MVILSFNAEKGGKYTALADGLRAMLVSRLNLKEAVTVIDNGLTKEEERLFLAPGVSSRQSVFAKLNTQYVAAGSMENSGDTLLLSIDIYSDKNDSPLRVVMKADGENQIIGGIETLAQGIVDKISGPAAAAAVVDKLPVQGIEAFRTEHPDRKYKEEIISGSAVVGSQYDVSSANGELLRRRVALPSTTVSIAVGDGDGDGSEEIFVAGEHELRIYHYDEGVLEQLAVMEVDPTVKIHALHVADINGDGKVEMYLSAADADDFSSKLLSWQNDKGIQELNGDIRWAIKPVTLPGKGLILAGQARSVGSLGGDEFFAPGVYELKIDAGTNTISRGSKINLPQNADLFDFVFADVNGDGRAETVAITRDMKMAVFDQQNRMMWQSEEDFGGSTIYLGSRWREKSGKPAGFTGDDENYVNLYYLPTSMIAKDVNGDGKDDIIVAKNTLSTYRVLNNLRNFENGNVVCLGWNGSAMSELWATDKLSGMIIGYYLISNFKNVGKITGVAAQEGSTNVRLFAGQVPTSGVSTMLSFADDKASLVVYDFRIMEKKE